MKLHVESFSHTGRVRDHNEDCVLVREAQGLFAVTDGVGGSVGGEVASALCCETLGLALSALRPIAEVQATASVVQHHREALHAAVAVANEVVHRQAAARGLQGMATTVVVAILSPAGMILAHVGDSRCYLLRDRKMFLLTRDHNMLEALVASGKSRAEAERHPYALHLLEGVGVREDDVHIDVAGIDVQVGDVVLLCTDGLTDEIVPETIARILQGSDPARPDAAAQGLLDAVLRTEARDNVSAIVVKVLQ